MRAVPLAAAALVAVLLSACSPSVEPTPDPTTPAPVTTSAAPTPDPTTPSPDPTTEPPTPTPSETLDPDQIAARDTVDEFFRLYTELASDPALPLQPLMEVTTGRTQESFIREIAELRDSGLVTIGKVHWAIDEISTVHTTEAGRIISVTVCSDSTESDTIQVETGESILPEERANFYVWELDVVQENGIWKVGDLGNERTDSCSDL